NWFNGVATYTGKGFQTLRESQAHIVDRRRNRFGGAAGVAISPQPGVAQFQLECRLGGDPTSPRLVHRGFDRADLRQLFDPHLALADADGRARTVLAGAQRNRDWLHRDGTTGPPSRARAALLHRAEASRRVLAPARRLGARTGAGYGRGGALGWPRSQ